MPFQLDDYDVSILKSLLKDGRKSFRKISRETGITTPTVKARFTRLVNIGFIESVSPILNFNIIEEHSKLKHTHENEDSVGKVNENNILKINQQESRFKIKKGLKIKLDCEFCKGHIYADPHIFRFANYERFFCCAGCMSGYKQKYAGRIESIKRRVEVR